MSSPAESPSPGLRQQQRIRLFLCGDVITGRGIDQVLAHPCDPHLHEDYVRSAIDYVRIAEQINGPIPRKAEPAYVWAPRWMHGFAWRQTFVSSISKRVLP